jgi:hypothetical protein
MRKLNSLGGVAVGAVFGLVAAMFYRGQPRPAGAASNDRYEDYIMATGAVSINPRVQTDGVWLLDYRTGKLLGTVIDKTQGKIVGFAEVDLTSEFGLSPKQDVHFLMTTGFVTQGQSALYLAETATGKFGVYTMGPGPNGMGIMIRRHDMTSFRPVAEAPAGKAKEGPPLVPGAADPMVPPPGGNLPPAGTAPTVPPQSGPATVAPPRPGG